MQTGEVQVYGIAPEQYGERMALFLQWQQLDFPVLMDPLNLLGVKAVPITLLVDQSGVIRYRNPGPGELKDFLRSEYPLRKSAKAPPALHLLTEEFSNALRASDEEAGSAALGRFHELEEGAQTPELSFQAGVIARWLYDLGGRPKLFQTAIDCWKGALEEVPGQYIWRRRIQQYGPRLDKPYPFYDWVEEAQKEVVARGEQPVQLTVEPSGSEVAQPLRKAEVLRNRDYPDVQNKLPNEKELLEITTTLIPHTDRAETLRIHLQLQPQREGHWSSDAQEVELWLFPADGEAILLASEASAIDEKNEVSSEQRSLEADCSTELLDSGKLVLFYSLCEEKAGVCRFLKSEWEIAEEVAE